jgi:ERCC4-related helicase
MPQLTNVNGFNKKVCYMKYFGRQPYKADCMKCDPTYDTMNACYNAMHDDMDNPKLSGIKELIQECIKQVDEWKD